jgi:hypothetical protein
VFPGVVKALHSFETSGNIATVLPPRTPESYQNRSANQNSRIHDLLKISIKLKFSAERTHPVSRSRTSELNSPTTITACTWRHAYNATLSYMLTQPTCLSWPLELPPLCLHTDVLSYRPAAPLINPTINIVLSNEWAFALPFLSVLNLLRCLRNKCLLQRRCARAPNGILSTTGACSWTVGVSVNIEQC